MSFWTKVFGWWDGETLNTRFWTWRKGQKVGEDYLGNIYYQSRDEKRRWVIYGGESEASTVPPQWHGWLHHTFDLPPTEDPLPRQVWELPPQSNLTGLPEAYRPLGSIVHAEPLVRRDYEAWSPDQG